MNPRGRYRAADLLDVIVNTAIMFILLVILWPVFGRARQNAQRASCQSNLKQIMLGALQYQQDYNGTFPAKYLSVSSPVYGWNDSLLPYVKATSVFHCPTAKTDSSLGQVADYWFNTRLSGAYYDYLSHPAWTIVAGDGQANCALSDAHYSIMSLPPEWRTNTESPVYRHLNGANYAFADGHVKWYAPERIQNTAPPSKGMPTFRTGEDRLKTVHSRRKNPS